MRWPPKQSLGGGVRRFFVRRITHESNRKKKSKKRESEFVAPFEGCEGPPRRRRSPMSTLLSPGGLREESVPPRPV